MKDFNFNDAVLTPIAYILASLWLLVIVIAANETVLRPIIEWFK